MAAAAHFYTVLIVFLAVSHVVFTLRFKIVIPDLDRNVDQLFVVLCHPPPPPPHLFTTQIWLVAMSRWPGSLADVKFSGCICCMCRRVVGFSHLGPFGEVVVEVLCLSVFRYWKLRVKG